MIGKHSYVGGFSIGQDPQQPCTIGDYTGIGKGLYVHPGDNWSSIGDRKIVANFPFGNGLPSLSGTGRSKGEVVIGNDVYMGEDVKILTGVTIGNGCIIGAHSVVTKNIPDYAMAAGNPARVKYFRFSPEIIEKLLEIKWWDWSEEDIKNRIGDFYDIETFIKKYG